jgi:hypothetical protein
MVGVMATSDSTEPAPALPDELRGLTYEQATPEQVAQVRAHVRAMLAAAERWTDEEREQRRAAFLRRLDAA